MMRLSSRLKGGHRISVVSACMTVLFVLCVSARGESKAPDDVAARLAKMPRPWKKAIHRLTQDEYEETLRFWQGRHAGILTVERVKESAKGSGIYLLRITDKLVPDADKQVCLLTALHGGPERTGTTSLLHLAEWLLSKDAEAAEVRRKQIVLIMPIVNPEAFFVTDRFGTAGGIEPYTGGGTKNWDLKTLTFRQAEKSPEVMAVVSVVDRYKPEVHCDMHGVGLQEYPVSKLGDRVMRQGHTMFESSGSSYSNYTLRPWDWRVTEAMVAAAREAGYGSDRYEAVAQRCFWGPPLEPLSLKLWLGRTAFYTPHYAYAKYHTMISAMEIGWEESGVARLKGLLRIGNNTWEDEPAAGYPVNRVKALWSHSVEAWGRTAQERRRSRVELWERQSGFGHAMLYPQFACRDLFVCAVTNAAAALLDADKEKFCANLKNVAGFRADAIEAFVRTGPEIKLVIDRRRSPQQARPEPIQHGIALRLRIPYRDPELVDLRLNGHLLSQDRSDGFHRWYADGYTQVQINVPPAKARKSRIFIVTCAYKPDVQRSYGWEPPQEVVERLKERKQSP